MGMVLGHHIPGRLGPAPAVDTCSYAVKFDGVSPASPNLRFRYDVRFRPDGLRAWTHHGGDSHPSFDDTFQFEIPVPWQLFGWVAGPSQELAGDTFNRTIDWHDNGTKLTMLHRWFSSFRRLDTFDQSASPYDITVLGPTFASRTGIPGSEFLVRWNLETAAGGLESGDHVFITRNTIVDKFVCTTPHDISTMNLTPVQTFDAAPDGGRLNQMGFSADHTKIYAINQSGLLLSWDLTAPDDISAPFNFQTGVNINALPEGINNLGIARGMNIRPDTGDLIYFGDQNNFRVRCWAGGIAPTIDDDFNDVVLLLDFAGPDGSTNITDLSNSSHNETFFDNAQVDTAVRALGQNTLLLDGAGDLITFPDSIDWDFGTGDFTIEFNIDLDVLTSQTFVGNYLTGSGADKGISIELQGGAPDLRVLRGDDVLATVVWAGAAINTDFHIAVTRSGTDLRIFVDGSELVSVVDSSDFSGAVQPWRIGSLDGAAQFLDGNIGAVRVTKGTARYTAPFTPSPCFYPNLGAPASSIFASGAPSIIKPIASPAGAANLQPAAALGYKFSAISALLTQGNGGIPPGPYTVPAPGSPAPGDLLVAWAAAGPGYVGQSSITLREGDFPVGFQPWSPTGGIIIIDPVTGRVVIGIFPRIATGDIKDDCIMFGVGAVPFALQVALFTNAWPFGLGSITADNEDSIILPDAALFREDAPNNGFDHLLDVWATAKKASPVVVGATTGADASEPTIVVGGAFGYLDNGFGDGMSGVFGYRITPDGNPGVPAGNWSMDFVEPNDTFAVSARWKSADS